MNIPTLRELPRVVLAVLFIAIMIVASLWIMQPFLPALIWSTLVVVSTWPVMLAVQRRLWGKRSLAVVVMTTGLLVILILPMAFAVLTIMEHADDVSDRIKALVQVGVPAGTDVVVRLEEALSTRAARREDRFEATVLDPVRVSGAVAIPAGARVRGVVLDAQPGERPSRSGRLELQFDALYIDRDRLDIRGRVVSLEQRTDEERKRKAGLGTILGGRKGAVVGVLVGAGGAVLGSKGEDIELPEGAVLVMRLDRELVVPRR